MKVCFCKGLTYAKECTCSYHDMPGMMVYRIVQTKIGPALVINYDKINNSIDVSFGDGRHLSGLKYEDVTLSPLLLKRFKR